MPNLDVYRPADAVETAECWALALAQGGRAVAARADPAEPAAAARSRPRENLCAKGAYRLRAATGAAQGRAARDRLGGRGRAATSPTRLKGRGSAPTSSRCPAGACSTPRTPAYRADILPARRAARLDRGRRDVRLGALYRPRRPRHRPRPVRRLGAGRGSVQALRLHRRGDRAADRRGAQTEGDQ